LKRIETTGWWPGKGREGWRKTKKREELKEGKMRASGYCGDG
jgi:hypothetical protein